MKDGMAQDYIEQRDGGYYIKGTRFPLDSIVHEFRNGMSAESIRQAFPILTLEQVYGAVAFILGTRRKWTSPCATPSRLGRRSKLHIPRRNQSETPCVKPATE